MRSERAEAALLAIQLHGREAEVFLDGVSRDAFRQDRRTFHAVTRCLEIISEATRWLPEPLKARHSHLPWRDITDAGNVYRHEYDNVAADFVFKTSKADLPLLLAAVEEELRRSPLEPDQEV